VGGCTLAAVEAVLADGDVLLANLFLCRNEAADDAWGIGSCLLMLGHIPGDSGITVAP
jgi:hypothetical protein